MRDAGPTRRDDDDDDDDDSNNGEDLEVGTIENQRQPVPRTGSSPAVSQLVKVCTRDTDLTLPSPPPSQAANTFDSPPPPPRSPSTRPTARGDLKGASRAFPEGIAESRPLSLSCTPRIPTSRKYHLEVRKVSERPRRGLRRKRERRTRDSAEDCLAEIMRPAMIHQRGFDPVFARNSEDRKASLPVRASRRRNHSAIRSGQNEERIRMYFKGNARVGRIYVEIMQSSVVHLRQRLDNAVSSSRDRAFPLDATLAMIQTLIDCDEFQDIATLRNLDELLDHKSDLSEKLCQIGDSIVYKLVQWTKRLPFYLELPVEVHTRLLTHKWHELLVLTTSAYQAMHGQHKFTNVGTDGTGADFMQEVSNNMYTLQTCLTSMMGRPITMDQLRQDVGLMVEKITYVTLMFRRVRLRMEEYVCLKVITMLSQARGGTMELEQIQERYMSCLRSFVEHSAPQQPSRFHDLLVRLPEVQSAAALLLESKMFYVPFLLNSAIQR
ncbi:hypothetical protein KM043_015317 [Ampulex compressa]|nr:hypothetical protein KM043_015317 [Ampulex compressa]